MGVHYFKISRRSALTLVYIHILTAYNTVVGLSETHLQENDVENHKTPYAFGKKNPFHVAFY